MERFAKKPKQLRKVSTNQIFAYTDRLAERADMVAVWEPGEEPVFQNTPSGGLSVDVANVDAGIKAQLHEKDKLILRLEKQIDLLGEENQKLNARIEELENPPSAEQEESVDTVSEKEPAPHDGLTTAQRLELLTNKTIEMLEKNDVNDFTGSGLPRVERLESWAGIAEVTAQERNDAFEAAKKLISEE